MALPGTGFRSVLSVALEMSFHLLEPIISSNLLSAITSTGPQTVPVTSVGIPIPALYPGAWIVIDTGANQEIVTVTDFNPSTSPPTLTASFTFTHPAGTIVQGATFPVQAASGDYFFSQTEILSYLARAQNEFLAECPCMFGIDTQAVQPGQTYQQLVCNGIEMERVSSSSQYIALTSLTRLGSGGYGQGGFGEGGFGQGDSSTPGLVTAVSQSPHGLTPNQKFSIYNTPDPSFTGAFRVSAVTNPTTFTYYQYGQSTATTYGGAAVLWLRLLETSQEELSIQNPFWKNQNIPRLRSWYEDRTGLYRWGVDGKPSSGFPVEILISQRDTDTLEFTDGFLVPDVMLHIIRYRALGYAASKDGEMRSPLVEKYCEMRWKRGLAAVHRWLDGMGVDLGSRKESIIHG